MALISNIVTLMDEALQFLFMEVEIFHLFSYGKLQKILVLHLKKCCNTNNGVV